MANYHIKPIAWKTGTQTPGSPNLENGDGVLYFTLLYFTLHKRFSIEIQKKIFFSIFIIIISKTYIFNHIFMKSHNDIINKSSYSLCNKQVLNIVNLYTKKCPEKVEPLLGVFPFHNDRWWIIKVSSWKKMRQWLTIDTSKIKKDRVDVCSGLEHSFLHRLS